DPATVGKERGNFCCGRGLLDRDVERDIDIPAGRGASASHSSAPRTATLGETLTEKLAEDVFRAVGIGPRAARTKLEAHAPGPMTLLPAPERCERIAMRTGIEALELRLAFPIDFAAIESTTALLIAENFIGLVRGRKALLRLGVVRILVRMIL